MMKCNPKEAVQPVDVAADPLTEMLRQGAKDLIAQAVESELLTLLDQHQGLRLLDGRQGWSKPFAQGTGSAGECDDQSFLFLEVG